MRNAESNIITSLVLQVTSISKHFADLTAISIRSQQIAPRWDVNKNLEQRETSLGGGNKDRTRRGRPHCRAPRFSLPNRQTTEGSAVIRRSPLHLDRLWCIWFYAMPYSAKRASRNAASVLARRTSSVLPASSRAFTSNPYRSAPRARPSSIPSARPSALP